VLQWLAGPGFAPFFERWDQFEHRSAVEFRQRYLIRALRGFVPVK
jgi:hypothetical protein